MLVEITILNEHVQDEVLVLYSSILSSTYNSFGTSSSMENTLRSFCITN